MKTGIMCCLAAGMLVATYGIAAAEDDFGIPRYPGAKSDAATQAICSAPIPPLFKEREEEAGLTSARRCYRTSDPIAKVAEFYKSQKGLTGGELGDPGGLMSANLCKSPEGACNERTVGTNVNIATPWLANFNMNNDVLIFITNRVKK